MYLGRIVESGDIDEVFDGPQHPYTKALMSAVPVPDPEYERSHERIVLEGDLPSPTEHIEGCAFASRCPLYKQLTEEQRKKCDTMVPQTRDCDVDHKAACHWIKI